MTATALLNRSHTANRTGKQVLKVVVSSTPLVIKCFAFFIYVNRVCSKLFLDTDFKKQLIIIKQNLFVEVQVEEI